MASTAQLNHQNIWVGKIRQIGPHSFRIYFGVGKKHQSRNAPSLAEAERLQESLRHGDIPDAQRPKAVTDELIRQTYRELHNSGRGAKRLGISQARFLKRLKAIGEELAEPARTGCLWLSGDIWMVNWWVGETQYTRTSGSTIKAEAEELKEKWTREQFIPPPTRIERKKGEGCLWRPKKSKILHLDWNVDGVRCKASCLTAKDEIAESLREHITTNRLTKEAAKAFLLSKAVERSEPKPCLSCGQPIAPSPGTGLVDPRRDYCDNCPPSRRRKAKTELKEKICDDCQEKFLYHPSEWMKHRCEKCQREYEKNWSALGKAEDRVKRLQEELKSAVEELERLQLEGQPAEVKIADAVNRTIPRMQALLELPAVKSNPRVLLDDWTHPDYEWEEIRAARDAVISRRPRKEWPKNAAIFYVALTQNLERDTVRRYYSSALGSQNND